MTPRSLLGLSAALMAALFVVLLVLQGWMLPDAQLFGLLLSAVMSLTCAGLVWRARTFRGAARAYSSVLAIALVGSLAAAVTHHRLGDVLGLWASVVGALGCAVHAIARLKAPAVDDAVISPTAIAAFHRLTEKLSDEVSEALQALSEATELSEPFVLERLAHLRGEILRAEGWSGRLRLSSTDPGCGTLRALRRRVGER